MPRAFDDVPGSLPPDDIPPGFDLSTTSFPDLAETVLKNLPASCLDANCLWRDFLCMAGQIRTFSGSERIKEEWGSYSHERVPRNLKAAGARVSRPTPNSSWIDVTF